MQQLADIEESLTLFSEGIAGRYLHIKASEEFVSHLGLKLDLLGAGQTHDTIYLPNELDAPSSGAYRFLVMEQIGPVSYTHLRAHETLRLSRMPSSA